MQGAHSRTERGQADLKVVAPVRGDGVSLSQQFPSSRAEDYVLVMNSAQVFALNVVFELHHRLPEHGERSRLNDRRKRRVRSVVTLNLLGGRAYSSQRSEYSEKE